MCHLQLIPGPWLHYLRFGASALVPKTEADPFTCVSTTQHNDALHSRHPSSLSGGASLWRFCHACRARQAQRPHALPPKRPAKTRQRPPRQRRPARRGHGGRSCRWRCRGAPSAPPSRHTPPSARARPRPQPPHHPRRRRPSSGSRPGHRLPAPSSAPSRPRQRRDPCLPVHMRTNRSPSLLSPHPNLLEAPVLCLLGCLSSSPASEQLLPGHLPCFYAGSAPDPARARAAVSVCAGGGGAGACDGAIPPRCLRARALRRVQAQPAARGGGAIGGSASAACPEDL